MRLKFDNASTYHTHITMNCYAPVLLFSMIGMVASGILYNHHILNMSSFIVLMLIGSLTIVLVCVAGVVSRVEGHRQQAAVVPQASTVRIAPTIKPIPETETIVESDEEACLGKTSNDEFVIIINPPNC